MYQDKVEKHTQVHLISNGKRNTNTCNCLFINIYMSEELGLDVGPLHLNILPKIKLEDYRNQVQPDLDVKVFSSAWNMV